MQIKIQTILSSAPYKFELTTLNKMIIFVFPEILDFYLFIIWCGKCKQTWREQMSCRMTAK